MSMLHISYNSLVESVILCYIMLILLSVEKIVVVVTDGCNPIVPYHLLEGVPLSPPMLDTTAVHGSDPFEDNEAAYLAQGVCLFAVVIGFWMDFFRAFKVYLLCIN